MDREDRPTTADIAGRETGDARADDQMVERPTGEERPREEVTPHDLQGRDTDTDTRADSLEERLGEPAGDVDRDSDAGASGVDEDRRLLGDDATSDVQSRWQQIQGGFVDEPRRAVEDADALVADLMQRLADSFAQERSRLESQWARGDEVSTEDLRVALQRYRSFFDRLLSA
jgi:hypothetical protein